MPDSLTPPTMATPDAPDNIAPIETRLTSDQISELDKMNSAFGGDQLGDQPAKTPTPGDEGKEVSPSPPATTPPPADTKLPTSVEPNEFIPPDGDVPVTEPDKGEKPQTVADLKDGKELFPDEAIDKLRTEKSKGDIRGLREHYDTARELVARLTKENGELKAAKPQDTDARIKDLETRNAELNALVEKHALKEHPFVQKNFTQPRRDALAYAKKAIEMTDIEDGHKVLERALGMSGRERIAALDQIYDSIESKSLRSRIEQAVTAIETIDERESAFFADREGNAARMQQEQRANEQRMLAEQETNFSSAIEKTVDYLANQKNFTFFKKSGKPEGAKWDEGLESDINEAREILLRNTDPMKLISLVLLGIRAPRMQVAYQTLRGAIAERDKALAEFRGGTPQINGGQPPPTPGTADPNENLFQAAQREIRNAQG